MHLRVPDVLRTGPGWTPAWAASQAAGQVTWTHRRTSMAHIWHSRTNPNAEAYRRIESTTRGARRAGRACRSCSLRPATTPGQRPDSVQRSAGQAPSTVANLPSLLLRRGPRRPQRSQKGRASSRSASTRRKLSKPHVLMPSRSTSLWMRAARSPSERASRAYSRCVGSSRCAP
jgi:hypothetical protein